MTKKQRFLTSLINALIMSLLMSFTMTMVNMGPDKFHLMAWARAWLISFIVAFPISYFLPGKISKFVQKHF